MCALHLSCLELIAIHATYTLTLMLSDTHTRYICMFSWYKHEPHV